VSDSTPSLVSALTLLASAMALLAFAAPAAASTPCGTRVAEDWRDNGRIDGVYELHCYEEGIEAIPSEIRDYSDAEDVIRSAYLSAGGTRPLKLGPGEEPGDSSPRDPVAAPAVDTSASSDLPMPVLILGVTALVLVASGAIGYFSRRRAGTDEDRLV
jgi:hypothetical protein